MTWQNSEIPGASDCIYGVRLKNGKLYEYDYQLYPKGKLVKVTDSIKFTKQYFVDGINKRLDHFKGRIMENNKWTPKLSVENQKKFNHGGILALCPGLEKALDDSLGRYFADQKVIAETTNNSEST
jgi:hypothetical protein